MRTGYVGWELPEKERARLLALFPPLYPNVVAHHVTHKFGVNESEQLPVTTNLVVVADTNDNNGVQCLIVSVNDSLVRPDGSVYHITWSLANGRKPVESNNVAIYWYSSIKCATRGLSVPINSIPKFFPH